mmetsp:Transcript_30641/g.76699  ORF Transcript_30641/g.76699 Transcript_30641/m.76699 type:complete len:343 (-) Transcript_30641:249-1277(-)
MKAAAPPPPYETSGFDEGPARALLSRHQWPPGLQDACMLTRRAFAHRYWIVDNSGSMSTPDGSRLEQGAGTERLVGCSRWVEVADAIEFHGELAAVLQAPTTFAFLNPPRTGAQRVVVSSAANLPELRAAAASGPGGGTPLCEHVQAIAALIAADEARLRAAGQMVVLVIVSDGLPTDGDLAAAMQPLTKLPVWIVVRLCCDEERVIKFWAELDSQLELDMDVLDDLKSEAEECSSLNQWFTYGVQLHRLREWGVHEKILDLLDERALSSAEVRDLFAFVFGQGAAALPHPELDLSAFVLALDALQFKFPQPFNALRGRRTPWLNVKLLKRHLKPGGGCAIM